MDQIRTLPLILKEADWDMLLMRHRVLLIVAESSAAVKTIADADKRFDRPVALLCVELRSPGIAHH